MINKLLKEPFWTSETNGKFFDVLNDYFNEDKCEIVVEVATELMKRGDNENLTAAETILIYATQRYFEVNDSNYKAKIYYCLGKFYELYKENFIKAYTYYEKYTLNNTINEGNSSIMLKALILRDDFTYSDELREHWSNATAELNLGLMNDRVYEYIGSLIIAQKEGDTDYAVKLKKRLKALVKHDEMFYLDLIFKKDTLPDSLIVPPKVIRYIKNL